MRRARSTAASTRSSTFSGIERFIDTPVKRYSSGMYVRLAFAVAAHLEPEILLIDEVLAVGDAAFQRKCLGRMHDVGDAAAGRSSSSATTSPPSTPLQPRTLDDRRPSRQRSTSRRDRRLPQGRRAAEARHGDDEDDTIRAGQRGCPAAASSSQRWTATRSTAGGRPTVRATPGNRGPPIPEASSRWALAADGTRFVTALNTDHGGPLELGPAGASRSRSKRAAPGRVRDGRRHPSGRSHHDSVERVLTFGGSTWPSRARRYPWDVVRGYVRAHWEWTGPP